MNSFSHSGSVAPRPPGRPREFDIDEMLDKAVQVFRQRGFHATSISDLSDAVGLPTGRPEVMDEYVRVYTQPGGARAAFSYYRDAFSKAGLTQNATRAERKLSMPVLAIGGQFSVGDGMASTMRGIATDVSGKQLQGCGHFVLEECPEAVASALRDFLHKK